MNKTREVFISSSLQIPVNLKRLLIMSISELISSVFFLCVINPLFDVGHLITYLLFLPDFIVYLFLANCIKIILLGNDISKAVFIFLYHSAGI